MVTPPRHQAPIPPQPLPLPGTEPLTPDTVRLLGRLSLRQLDPGLLAYVAAAALLVGGLWLVGGLPYGVPLDPMRAVMATVVVFLVPLALLPFGIRWSIRRWRRQGWVVGYFDDAATMIVHPTPEGAWLLSDHVAAHRGRGLATPFRRRVFGHLASEADRLQVVIVTETRVPRLCRLYLDDMPGLQLVNDTRRDFIARRIYDLRREAAAPPPG
jgi:hypothetical protein